MILVLLTLMRPPKGLFIISLHLAWMFAVTASVFTGYEMFVMRDTAEWLLSIRSLADDTICKL